MRGKDVREMFTSQKKLGSPPLARERRKSPRVIRKNNRITPACAGKTYGDDLGKTLGEDHPRLRGKDVIMKISRIKWRGSPPLARERLKETTIQISDTRITPACAGKTHFNSIKSLLFWDHPRLRGKDSMRSS